MTETAPLTIRCHHVDGTPAAFAEVVRAVYAGEADPGEYVTTLEGRSDRRPPRDAGAPPRPAATRPHTGHSARSEFGSKVR